LCNTHLFYPIAIETAGTWYNMAIKLTEEIGRRITMAIEDTIRKQHVPELVRGSPEVECGLISKYLTH